MIAREARCQGSEKSRTCAGEGVCGDVGSVDPISAWLHLANVRVGLLFMITESVGRPGGLDLEMWVTNRRIFHGIYCSAEKELF